jgi:hypothetical protein
MVKVVGKIKKRRTIVIGAQKKAKLLPIPTEKK